MCIFRSNRKWTECTCASFHIYMQCTLADKLLVLILNSYHNVATVWLCDYSRLWRVRCEAGGRWSQRDSSDWNSNPRDSLQLEPTVPWTIQELYRGFLCQICRRRRRQSCTDLVRIITIIIIFNYRLFKLPYEALAKYSPYRCLRKNTYSSID